MERGVGIAEFRGTGVWYGGHPSQPTISLTHVQWYKCHVYDISRRV